MTRQTDINLTAIMERDDIKKVERFRGGWYLVALFNGQSGSGNSVGEALEAAMSSERIAA